jgi:hypothetical protein
MGLSGTPNRIPCQIGSKQVPNRRNTGHNYEHQFANATRNYAQELTPAKQVVPGNHRLGYLRVLKKGPIWGLFGACILCYRGLKGAKKGPFWGHSGPTWYQFWTPNLTPRSSLAEKGRFTRVYVGRPNRGQKGPQKGV